MNLLLFSGFLGSGKTTAIIKLVRHLVSRDRKVAILVNEIGDVGIDNQMMKQLDLNVWELLAGCICCTLAIDLVETLKKLEEEFSVDTVIVEPSGAADPKNILNSLAWFKGKTLERSETVSIIDPLRLEVFMKVITPLLTSQINSADMVLITKCDSATSEELDNARKTVTDINPDVRIITAGKETTGEELAGKLMPWMD